LKETPNIKIYVVGHKPYEAIPSDGIFVPIQTGKEEEFCSLRDNTGDNIADKNGCFCELTALYWIWRNTSGQDYVGLFHYRRHFDFSGIPKEINRFNQVVYERNDEAYLKANALNDEAVLELVPNYDIILPTKWNVHDGKPKWMSIERHYALARHHLIKDYEEAIEVLKQKYPDYAPYADAFNKGSEGYFCNMFIMRRAIFDKYCAWLFDILFELEKRLNLSDYSEQQKRVFGYIGERLLNIFLEKLLADEPGLKVKTLQASFIKNVKFFPRILPIYPEGGICIVMAFNDEFAPYASVTLRSIAENASRDWRYDIAIFDGEISEENKRLLNETLKEFPNFKLRYIATAGMLESDSAPAHLHISRDTYYRLFIPKIFSAYKKVIYIDADMIVRRDIAELWNKDLGDKAIAAAPCAIMAGFRDAKTASVPDKIPAEAYLKGSLRLKHPADYFQAGILVFSIQKALEKQAQIEEMLYSNKQYWFMDQDILNSAYQGDVLSLDPRWNVVNGNGNTEIFFKKLPEPERSLYFEARKDPFIIHFAGENKPWLSDKGDFHDLFWKYARKTPFYEYILRNFTVRTVFGNYSPAALEIQKGNQLSLTRKYTLFGIPFLTVKQTKLSKNYNIGSFPIAKTKNGKENTYLYILGIKCASIRYKINHRR